MGGGLTVDGGGKGEHHLADGVGAGAADQRSNPQGLRTDAVASAQMAQGSVVSRAPQMEHVRTRAAASASASLKGWSSWSRRFSRASVARRAERGPRPGSFASKAIKRSISGPAEAAIRAV